jgi:hypothetical protein
MNYPSPSPSQSASASSRKCFGKQAGLVSVLAPLALAGAALGLAANPAQALTLFAGPYAPANWTQTVQGDGSISNGGAPGSITLNGANDGSNINQNVDFAIAAPASGAVSFGWSYNTSDGDGPQWDPFGYLLNGSLTRLASNGGSKVQSGTASFSVLTGDVLGFRQNSVDSRLGRASTTISNSMVLLSQALCPCSLRVPLGVGVVVCASASPLLGSQRPGPDCTPDVPSSPAKSRASLWLPSSAIPFSALCGSPWPHFTHTTLQPGPPSPGSASSTRST